jgi:hypothetical protein
MQWTTDEQQWQTEDYQWVTGASDWGGGTVWPTSATSRRIYLFVLTGVADGLDDITIPIASCQMRRRDGEPTYMSVVVPDYDDYLDAISARQNGQMVFSGGYLLSDGSEVTSEIARVSMETINPAAGPRSRAITLVGHGTQYTTVPETRTITGAGTRSMPGGKISFRADVDLDLNPGDTAVVDGESFVVGYISYIIAVGLEYMDITEA